MEIKTLATKAEMKLTYKKSTFDQIEKKWTSLKF